MSGSPIVQNGKLVGAVTHVLVNDPTRGYGIIWRKPNTEEKRSFFEVLGCGRINDLTGVFAPVIFFAD